MSRVYFVQQESGGPIKIGYTTNVEARVRDLNVGSPTQIICLRHAPGSRETEKMLHEMFSAHRIRGEWFSPSPDIMDFIQNGETGFTEAPALPSGPAQITEKSAIKPARHKLGWTQQQLAEKAGTSRRVVSGLETGQSNTNIDTFNRIVSAIRAEMEAGK